MFVKLNLYDFSGTKPNTVIINSEKIDYMIFQNGKFNLVINGKKTDFYIDSDTLNNHFKIYDTRNGKFNA